MKYVIVKPVETDIPKPDRKNNLFSFISDIPNGWYTIKKMKTNIPNPKTTMSFPGSESIKG